jgi:benzoylformate decarboxylase
VLALLGDGAALYGIQGLWSAAHHNIPITLVIANNSEYQILKKCGVEMKLDQTAAGSAPGLNLANPSVDFVALAKSLGVEAVRVESPDQLSELVREGLSATRPRLLEVPIEGHRSPKFRENS